MKAILLHYVIPYLLVFIGLCFSTVCFFIALSLFLMLFFHLIGALVRLFRHIKGLEPQRRALYYYFAGLGVYLSGLVYVITELNGRTSWGWLAAYVSLGIVLSSYYLTEVVYPMDDQEADRAL